MQDLAPSRSRLQGMRRKFKFKVRQKKHQGCCKKANKQTSPFIEKKRLRVGTHWGSGTRSWSLSASHTLTRTLESEVSRSGAVGRAEGSWLESSGLTLPVCNPFPLLLFLPPGAREWRGGACAGRGVAYRGVVMLGGERQNKRKQRASEWLSIPG